MKTKMPVLFIGHGSPMNAIEDNDFTRTLRSLPTSWPKPKAILCISAHWMTEGSWVTGMKTPKTIHDFYGFPQVLFDIQYPAPGSPEIAELICQITSQPKVHNDVEMWGLDHGTWSVLRHVYPDANIPVLQLSLHMEKPAEYHFKLGQQLRSLREQGVLIVGSGNIVHNLSALRWDTEAEPYEWAVEFDQWAKSKLMEGDYVALIHDFQTTPSGRQSVPTNEHYYPLLYVLGAADKNDALTFEFEGIQNSSISMRTFSLQSKSNPS